MITTQNPDFFSLVFRYHSNTGPFDSWTTRTTWILDKSSIQMVQICHQMVRFWNGGQNCFTVGIWINEMFPIPKWSIYQITIWIAGKKSVFRSKDALWLMAWIIDWLSTIQITVYITDYTLPGIWIAQVKVQYSLLRYSDAHCNYILNF